MTRTLPYAFTEQRVAMLSTILRTKVVEEISIRIMDAFVAMRKYINNNLIEQTYINKLVIKDHERINLSEAPLNNFEGKNIIIFYFLKKCYTKYIIKGGSL